MEKILVSACLLGRPVRYDGRHLAVKASLLDLTLTRWQEEGRVISVCPEVDAGMSTPRAPAEISGGDALGVIAGSARVVNDEGDNLSAYFVEGASIALALCQKYNVKIALLTEFSPSCGSSAIYDGKFTDHKIPGAGVTATLLQQHGIKVFSQHELVEASKALQCLS